MREASPKQAGSPGPIVGLCSAVVLCWLAAPDVSYRDAGELQAASFVLGVPHPTGFALDMLLLKLGAMLPLGHIAWRQNITVALVSAAVLALLAELTARLAERAGVAPARGGNQGAMLAALALGTWTNFLGSALSVEVYSTALVLLAMAGYGALRAGRYAGLPFLVAGLAAGVHVTVGLMVVPILAAALLSVPAGQRVRFVLVRLPLTAAGALVVLYLPLASLRNPPVDWGDPESLGALLAHLTAERYRTSFRGEMLGGDPGALLRLTQQVFEQWPALVVALLGLVFSILRARAAALAALCLLVGDLAYDVWINPMGIVDRQVGHLLGAILALFSGMGAAALVHLAWKRPPWRVAALALVFALCSAMVVRVPREPFPDRYTPSELFGSGGPFSELPPRAVVLCYSDNACAVGLFASHVEAIRPDLSLAPAQHLWDPVVLRGLDDLPVVRAFLARNQVLEPGQRRERARAVVRALARADSSRPVFLETDEPLRDAGYRGPIQLSPVVPYLRVAAGERTARRQPGPAQDPVQALDRLRRARLPRGRPSSQLSMAAWSVVYGRVGSGALNAGRNQLAVAAMRRAVQMAPFRPQAWTNLGVALQEIGDTQGAQEAVRRAILIDPGRPAAWANLVRFSLARGDLQTARMILDTAYKNGVRDARLDRLKERLKKSGAPRPISAGRDSASR